MKKKIIIAVGIIILIGLIIGVNIARNQGDKSLTVTTAKLTQGKISATIFVDGKVDLNGKRDIRSRIMGTVKEVKVNTGDHISSGQVLVYLDTKDLELQKEQAQTQLDMANDKLNQAKTVPATTIPGQTASADSAVKAAQLEVKSAQAALDKVKSQLVDAVIKSPIDGTVLSRAVQEGMTVTPDVVLFSVGNIKDLIIKAQISEMDILKIQKGQKVKITGESFADKQYNGEVSDIAQVPETLTGLAGVTAATASSDSTNYQVTIKITDQDTLLKPGFTTNLEVLTASKDNAKVIPNEALMEKDNKQVVYVVEKGLVKIKTVQTGITSDDKTEITGGLKVDDVVILNPDEKVLTENKKVKSND